MEPWWLRLLCLSLVIMRCQPLRRALAIRGEYVGIQINRRNH
ncbi:acetyltransferase [Vibrio cholerae]|nr:acetyltransferase [Vibrio cholerae]TXX76452.1 acetyltransferase [Vibrio cholerae]TYA67305.1 acetyltransferase [Vibrio cholerae]